MAGLIETPFKFVETIHKMELDKNLQKSKE